MMLFFPSKAPKPLQICRRRTLFKLTSVRTRSMRKILKRGLRQLRLTWFDLGSQRSSFCSCCDVLKRAESLYSWACCTVFDASFNGMLSQSLVGRLWSDMLQHVAQGSSSWSKCKGKVSWCGPLADWDKTWQARYPHGDLAIEMNWTWIPNSRVPRPKNWVKGPFMALKFHFRPKLILQNMFGIPTGV